jgi:hypothetical protein
VTEEHKYVKQLIFIMMKNEEIKKMKYSTPTVLVMELDPVCILAGSATAETGKWKQSSDTSTDDTWTDQ